MESATISLDNFVIEDNYKSKLIDFLTEMLKDSIELRLVTMNPHSDEYLEINDYFNELGLLYIKEESSVNIINQNHCKLIKIRFLRTLGELLELDNGEKI